MDIYNITSKNINQISYEDLTELCNMLANILTEYNRLRELYNSDKENLKYVIGEMSDLLDCCDHLLNQNDIIFFLICRLL